MSDTLFIPIIEGTTRPKRKSIHAAKFVEKIGRTFDRVEVQLVDPADYDLSKDGNDEENKIPEYTELVRRADGFFIVTPEYNHSYPGSLKSLLDKELQLYIHKPVAFAGVSSGMFGGVRAIEALVRTVREMGMTATFTDAFFPKVQELFEESGEIKPEHEELYTTIVSRSFEELIWMAKTLKWGRENLTEDS